MLYEVITGESCHGNVGSIGVQSPDDGENGDGFIVAQEYQRAGDDRRLCREVRQAGCRPVSQIFGACQHQLGNPQFDAYPGSGWGAFAVLSCGIHTGQPLAGAVHGDRPKGRICIASDAHGVCLLQ